MVRECKSIRKIKSNINVENNAIANAFINNASGDFENAEFQNRQGKKPRGRPKKASDREEKVRFTLYLTKQQDEQISTKAEELGFSKNNYIVYELFKKNIH